MLTSIINFIVETVSSLGYAGIFIMMFLESSFFPFPSEVVMIPAGYLAHKGEMNIYIVIVLGALGSLGGALFNYYFALKFGRTFLMTYGKYFFVSHETIEKTEVFIVNIGNRTPPDDVWARYQLQQLYDYNIGTDALKYSDDLWYRFKSVVYRTSDNTFDVTIATIPIMFPSNIFSTP